jgi:hypothetical protein
MKIIGLLGLLLFMFSCQDSKPITTKLNYPVCIDSLDVVPRMLAYEDSEERLGYNLLYIGAEKDTIFIDYKLGISLIMSPPPPPLPPSLNDSKGEVIADSITDNITRRWEDWSELRKVKDKFDAYWCSIYDPMEHYKHVIWDSAKVDVVVDTNRYLLHYSWFPVANESFKAYPVVIKNRENDTVVIATSHYVELVLEGETAGGWKTLKEPVRHIGCGNGLTFLLLPPNEILVTSIPVYKWKERTNLRLKLGNNYSTVFTGNKIVE